MAVINHAGAGGGRREKKIEEKRRRRKRKEKQTQNNGWRFASVYIRPREARGKGRRKGKEAQRNFVFSPRLGIHDFLLLFLSFVCCFWGDLFFILMR